MFKRTIIFLTLTSILALSMMTVPAAKAAPPAGAKWTVMVYMAGDNNLEPSIVTDIQTELAPLGSSSDIQVVALADRIPGYDASGGDWTGTLLFHVTQGMTATPGNAAADWGERNTGDPQTLIDFVQWAKTNYPANHYLLSFWGHGWSWRPAYTMADYTSADTLDPDEVAAAIPSLGFIDVIAYDACQMATSEIAHLWHDHAAAVSFSQEYVNWDGIEYDLVISDLYANPSMTADQVAVSVTQSASVNSERTWSAVAVDSRWDALVTAVDQWAIALNTGLAANRKTYTSAFRAARDFNADPTSKDLRGAAYEISTRIKDQNIKAKSNAVIAAYDALLLAEWHTSPYSGAHGLSIFLPMTKKQLDYAGTPQNDFVYYQSLRFAQDTHWDEFIAAYAQ